MDNQPERRNGQIVGAAKKITYPAMAAAILFAAQVALSSLPNVEIVSLLIVVYTIYFKRMTLGIIYVFALLEGLWYGFHIWWVMYLYVWTILYLVVRLFTRGDRTHIAPFWAVVAGLFGLSFGFWCSFPYLALGGPKVMITWWMAGLPFDAHHGLWNFILTLVLFTPLDRIFRLLKIGQ